jgi:periplasmic protein TonB
MSAQNKAELPAVSPQCAAEQNFGSLGGCLVEGDPGERLEQRRLRRRSLGISVGLQCASLAALVIAPLFAGTEKISHIVTPLPVYVHQPETPRKPVEVPPRALRPAHRVCALPRILPTIVTQISHRDDPTADLPVWPTAPAGPETPVLIAGGDSRSPVRPAAGDYKSDPPRRVSLGSIEPAMLTRRIEPVYPVLARQTGRAGRVELRAIIATDGSVESLEVVSGDPVFVRSALAAVGQWRYRPTMLDGQAVEVDTRITVIYSMPR